MSSGEQLSGRAVIAASDDILTLATGLLRVCRAGLPELIVADGDQGTWRARERLRADCVALFESIDDEDLDDHDRAALTGLAVAAAHLLPDVMIARTIAEALDEALGARFLPMFLGRDTPLAPGDPVPSPHPDWRDLSAAPNSDPWVLDGRLDALPHLRLAGDWASHLRITLKGDWRAWLALPQLRGGDRVACAVPNASLSELRMERACADGKALFYDVRVGDEERQRARCLELLELARAQGVRVVVFPELSVTRGIRRSLRAWLDRQDAVDLVVAGSAHRRARDGRFHNEASMYVRGLPGRITHRKFRPFSFVDSHAGEPVRRYEHLSVAAPRLDVWLSPHWSVVMLVCKDAVQQPVPQALTELRANLVLVPALSFKMDAFRTVAADVATWGQGVALIANAAFGATDDSPRPPVVAGVPSRHGSVLTEVPPPRSLYIITIGNPTQSPQVAAAATAA